jgi:hypothetical protein
VEYVQYSTYTVLNCKPVLSVSSKTNPTFCREIGVPKAVRLDRGWDSSIK